MITQPLPDTEVNARLAPLKAARDDEDGIAAALAGLLVDTAGRASLVQHRADFAALAIEPSLADAQRGRALRRHFDPEFIVSDDELERATDGSIIRLGVSGWNR